MSAVWDRDDITSSMMAVRCACLGSSVLLLVLALWTVGECGQGVPATPKISVGFLSPTFSGKEGEVAAATVRVEVPKDINLGDSNESLTFVVTSEDGEAKAGRDFELVEGTITLATGDLKRIQNNRLGHTNIAVEISLTEDEYIEPSQTFTLTLEVQTTLDVEEHITSAIFTINDKGSDTVKISFDQTTYTAYASQNAPLKLLKEGRIRQNISVDVTFSDDSLFQTILFKPSQNVIEVSFNPGGETQSYSLSLALAEPSHNLEGLVVMGAPAEVKVMEFTPEGRRIIRLLEGKINSTVVERQNEYSRLQEKYAVLQRRVEDLQGLKVEFEREQYYMAKNDESVKVCLKKKMATAEDLHVTVTAKKNKDSQKRDTGDEDASPIFQEEFIISAGSVKAECFGFDMTPGDKVGATFNLTLTVDDHTVPPNSTTVTITKSLTVSFEPSEYTVSKGDKAVKVCLTKNVNISEALNVKVTAVKEKESQKRATGSSVPSGSDDAPPPTSQAFTFLADSGAAQPDPCDNIGFPVEKGTFTLILDVKDHPKVESQPATVTIADDSTDPSGNSLPSPTPLPAPKAPSAPSAPDPSSSSATDPSSSSATDPMVFVWVVVVVIVLIVVVVAAYIIYHQRKKIKSCLALEEQGGKGRKGRYRKLPANIREALHQD